MIDPPPAGEHPGQERADGVEHRLGVDRERAVPVRVGAVEHGAGVHDAGAVEEDVEWPDLGRQGGDRGDVSDVQAPCGAPGQRRQQVLVDVGGDDLRALAHERLGACAADALRRRRHQRDLACQPSRHPRSLEASARPDAADDSRILAARVHVTQGKRIDDCRCDYDGNVARRRFPAWFILHTTCTSSLRLRSHQIAMVNAAVIPPAALPVTVASSSADPSLKTLSLASETRDRLVTLLS